MRRLIPGQANPQRSAPLSGRPLRVRPVLLNGKHHGQAQAGGTDGTAASSGNSRRARRFVWRSDGQAARAGRACCTATRLPRRTRPTRSNGNRGSTYLGGEEPADAASCARRHRAAKWAAEQMRRLLPAQQRARTWAPRTPTFAGFSSWLPAPHRFRASVAANHSSPAVRVKPTARSAKPNAAIMARFGLRCTAIGTVGNRFD